MRKVSILESVKTLSGNIGRAFITMKNGVISCLNYLIANLNYCINSTKVLAMNTINFAKEF